MKLLITFTFVLLFQQSFAQVELMQYYPTQEIIPDLFEQTFIDVARQNQLLSKDNLTVKEKSELDNLLLKYGEVVESPWDIIDGGCSWYCGGGNYKVSASSHLQSKTMNYEAKSANDLSYKTAWVEGNTNEGIGEYIEYIFENSSPRITTIISSNGYMKNDQLWKDNNRVKTLKLYINDKPFGILNLSDSKTDQFFKIGTFGRNIDGSDLKLKFEIQSVYKGGKFNDTAITEIYFDGIDVH